MNDSLILNPKSNRYVKKTSQTGKRLLKELATPEPTEPILEPTSVLSPLLSPEPVQTALVEACAELVAERPQQFKKLSASETDSLFKKLLLERLGVSTPVSKPKKKVSKYKVVESDSDESSDSD